MQVTPSGMGASPQPVISVLVLRLTRWPPMLQKFSFSSATAMYVRLAQELKGLPSICVVAAGMVIVISDLHSLKALSPMLFTLLPMVTVVRATHQVKAHVPMPSTLSGMVTVDSSPQSPKASSPIAVMP